MFDHLLGSRGTLWSRCSRSPRRHHARANWAIVPPSSSAMGVSRRTFSICSWPLSASNIDPIHS